MDIFVEYMVKKKRSAADCAAMAGIAVLASIVAFILFFIVAPLLGSFSMIALVALVGEVYFAYKWIISYNIEYEYSLVSDEIDVDKVLDQKSRKKMITFKVKGLDGFGVCKGSRLLPGYLKDDRIKKIYACSHMEDEGVYYALFTEKEVKNIIFFNPNEKMVNVIKKLNPLKIHEFELQ